MGIGRPTKTDNEDVKIEKPRKPLSMMTREEKNRLNKLLNEILVRRSPMSKMEQEEARARTEKEVARAVLKQQKQEKLEYARKLREYRISVSPFDCSLNKGQMAVLWQFFNDHLLKEPITIEEFDGILMGKNHDKKYCLKDERLFYLLLKGLSGEGYKYFNTNTTEGRDKVIQYFKPVDKHKYITIFWQKSIDQIISDNNIEFRNEHNYPINSKRISKLLHMTKKDVINQINHLEMLKKLFITLVELEICINYIDI